MNKPYKNLLRSGYEDSLEPRVLLAAGVESDPVLVPEPSITSGSSDSSTQQDSGNRTRRRRDRTRGERNDRTKGERNDQQTAVETSSSSAGNNNAPAASAPSSNSAAAPDVPAATVENNSREAPANSVGKISSQSTGSQIKARIGEIFDGDEQVQAAFSSIGFSRDESLAGLFGVASRESAGSSERGDGKVNFRPSLETGSGASHAFGVGQAAETSFQGGKFEPLNVSGKADIPHISLFSDPDAAARAFVTRISEGISLSQIENPGFSGVRHFLGSLAHHNTGHTEDAADPAWRRVYGDEVVRLQQGYLQGDNLTNAKVFYTGEEIEAVG